MKLVSWRSHLCTDVNIIKSWPAHFDSFFSAACSDSNSKTETIEYYHISPENQLLESDDDNWPVFKPCPILLSVKVERVFSKYGTNFVITASDKKLLAWGRSDYGQCGLVSATPIPTANAICIASQPVCSIHKDVESTLVLKPKIVANTVRNVCLLTEDGQLFEWGALNLDSDFTITEPQFVTAFSNRFVDLDCLQKSLPLIF